MPATTRDGVELHYERAGAGETVAFVGEAGYGAWQWGWQYDRVAGPFEALVWDLRGTGRSDAPPGPYSVDSMAADLEAVLAAAEARRAHVVGVGLGGMIALRYAREFGRAATLSLFGTAADGDRVDETALRDLHATGDDPERLRDSLSGAFSAAFLDRSDTVEQVCAWRRAEDAGAETFRAQAAAALGFAAGPLYELDVPALVCHGIEDPVVPVSVGRALGRDLPHGSFEAVEGRHLCFAEHARAVNDRLLYFFGEHAEPSWSQG
jgi:pimeloyl-ACP methyl ester carboxylesterase